MLMIDILTDEWSTQSRKFYFEIQCIYIMIYSVYCLQVFDITISEKLMRFPYSFCCYLSIMTFMYKLELLRPEYRWPMSFIH